VAPFPSLIHDCDVSLPFSLSESFNDPSGKFGLRQNLENQAHGCLPELSFKLTPKRLHEDCNDLSQEN
jgi:hypothetical protein